MDAQLSIASGPVLRLDMGFLCQRAQLCIKRVLLIDAYLPSEPHLAMQGGYVVHCKEAPEPLTKANQAMMAIDSIAGDVTNGSTPLYTGQTALDAAPAMSRPILHERSSDMCDKHPDY